MASSYNVGGGEIRQKKGGGGGGGTYVYKFDTSSATSGSNQKPQDRKKEHYFNSGISWGLRRSKTVREVVVNKNDPREDGAGGGKEDKVIVVEARRSSVCSGGGAGGGGGPHRKSVSHVEVNAAAVAAFLQVKVLVTDMPGFMQTHAFRCARSTYDSLHNFSSKHMAYSIKKEFDKVYGPAWHCIVGSSFGSFVTHSTGCFLYFCMEKLYILLFKTKVQRTLPQS